MLPEKSDLNNKRPINMSFIKRKHYNLKSKHGHKVMEEKPQMQRAVSIRFQ